MMRGANCRVHSKRLEGYERWFAVKEGAGPAIVGAAWVLEAARREGSGIATSEHVVSVQIALKVIDPAIRL